MLKKVNLLYSLVIFASLFIVTLSFWWLFLIFKVSDKLIAYHDPQVPHLLAMLKYEGLSLVVIIVCFIVSLSFIFINDKKKTNALTEFFASLSHELKTPLASMRLQSEIINDLVENDSINKTQLKELTGRLIEDNIKLENELDNTLQLSRLYRGGNYNLEKINLKSFLMQLSEEYKHSAKFNLMDIDQDTEVLADLFALKLIFRNLFQNTINHVKKEEKEITICIESTHPFTVRYFDNGGPFNGEVEKLTKLFYKYNSTNGSGIGLHLIDGLLAKMGGNFKIKSDQNLNFYLEFLKA